MFSRVLPKSYPKVFWHRGAVLTAGFPKVWANVPRLLVDPFVLDSRSFAPFRFRHDLARRPPNSDINSPMIFRTKSCWIASESDPQN